MRDAICSGADAASDVTDPTPGDAGGLPIVDPGTGNAGAGNLDGAGRRPVRGPVS
ncbi:Protein of unknown function [Propionibacterium freudenreichii]|nr:Protein of unknown function [Propionibacterium freudenreichii]